MPKKSAKPSQNVNIAAPPSPLSSDRVDDAPVEPTPSELIHRPAASCPVCKALGNHYYADFDKDMEMPEAMRQLEIVVTFFYDDDMRRCTLCGTYFRFHFETDNDIFQPTHTGEYDRIPAEKAEAMIREEKARVETSIKESRKRMRRVHKAVMVTMTPVDTQVFDYLIKRYCESHLGMQYTTKADIAKSLVLEDRVVDAAIAHLLELKVVESGRYSPDAFRIKTYRL